MLTRNMYVRLLSYTHWEFSGSFGFAYPALCMFYLLIRYLERITLGICMYTGYFPRVHTYHSMLTRNKYVLWWNRSFSLLDYWYSYFLFSRVASLIPYYIGLGLCSTSSSIRYQVRTFVCIIAAIWIHHSDLYSLLKLH